MRAARSAIRSSWFGLVSRASGPGFLSEPAAWCTAVEFAGLPYASIVGMGVGVRVVVIAIFGALALTACGGDHGGSGAAGPPPNGPVGTPQQFPSAAGNSPDDLR